ncbi:MAG: AmmeMemoRadiSam system protein B [Candidatus Omnitrophica bacterium]|nr:AmmeMemoRadiSam system protein B [Candidatus Omnitrophota bacterium]
MKQSALTILFAALFFTTTLFAMDIKRSDLAGTWYPDDKAKLTALLKSYLDNAQDEKIDGQLFAIISPHAGYQFSGPVAAYGFKAARNKNIKTVIVIGFSHRKYFDGISVYAKGAWQTPLGDAGIDEALAAELMSQNKRLRFEPELFDGENSVEMQIPFVQAALEGAKIVPVAFGTQDYKDAEILADALAAVLKGRRDVLVVASTDLSHYHPYKEANSIDKGLIDILTKMKAKELYSGASTGACELCGVMPVTAVLLAAEKAGYDGIKILKYANSGDTFGDKRQVVGYLSAAIYKKDAGIADQVVKKEKKSAMLNKAQRQRLLQIARESLTSYVKDGKRKTFTEDDPVLKQNMGAFVTLHENGELRGCIGNMIGRGPLYKTVADMAIESATGDPRFSQLSADEIGKVDIEISVLSPLKRVSGYEEVTIPGDGVLIKSGFRSGVFLPQVATETGWDRDEFLTYLCAHKAGLPPQAWKDPKTEIYTFSAEVFGEKGKGYEE